MARAAPAGTWFQVVWRPEGQEASEQNLAEYAFLLKRAAVALTGARGRRQGGDRGAPGRPRRRSSGLYGQEVAAYVDVLTLALPSRRRRRGSPPPSPPRRKADPGGPVALDAVPVPAEPAQVIAEAAREAVAGVDLTLFRPPETSTIAPPIAAALAPFALLAREFAGDVSYDAGSSPTGASAAWTFVRGKDQSLRVIAVAPPGAENGVLTLHFADRVAPPAGALPARRAGGCSPRPARRRPRGSTSRSPPRAASPSSGSSGRPPPSAGRGSPRSSPCPPTREMPVEEILRRLQAFEDAQDRRLDHYSAVNTTHLRFQASGRRAEPSRRPSRARSSSAAARATDWAWQTLLHQRRALARQAAPRDPAHPAGEGGGAAAGDPLHARSTATACAAPTTIDGRDAWVVDFAPAAAGRASREQALPGHGVGRPQALRAPAHARRAARPLRRGALERGDADLLAGRRGGQARRRGRAGASFVLPLHLVGAADPLRGQQHHRGRARDACSPRSRSTRPTSPRRGAQVDASDVTMVRDTDKGLRYLVKDKDGERVVKEGFATVASSSLAGGVFYDDSLDYPLPLAGVNYFTFDFKGPGQQAQRLLRRRPADRRRSPSRTCCGSRFDAGGNVFALAVPLTDTVFQRRQARSSSRTSRSLPASVGFQIGRPLGRLLEGRARLRPALHPLQPRRRHRRRLRPAERQLPPLLRAGDPVRARRLPAERQRQLQPALAAGTVWGEPDNPDFTPDDKSFYRWDAALAKSWYLPRFQRIGAELDYVSGSRPRPLQQVPVRLLRRHPRPRLRERQGAGDDGLLRPPDLRLRDRRAAAHRRGGRRRHRDRPADRPRQPAPRRHRHRGDLHRPVETVVNLDVGVPVAGPDHGFVMYLVFLKLFK